MVIFFHHKNTFSMLLWWIIMMLIDFIYFNIISLQWYYNFLLVVLFLKIYANYPNHKKRCRDYLSSLAHFCWFITVKRQIPRRLIVNNLLIKRVKCRAYSGNCFRHTHGFFMKTIIDPLRQLSHRRWIHPMTFRRRRNDCKQWSPAEHPSYTRRDPFSDNPCMGIDPAWHTCRTHRWSGSPPGQGGHIRRYI